MHTPQTQFGGNLAAAGGQQLIPRIEPAFPIQAGPQLAQAPGQFNVLGGPQLNQKVDVQFQPGPQLPVGAGVPVGAQEPIANRVDLGGPPVGAPGQAPGGPPLPAAPPTGLIGAEQALLAGGTGATGAILQGTAQARQDVLRGGIGAQQQILGGQGAEVLSGFAEPGQQAANLQAALTGALGPEAQAQAIQEFQQSPGQKFALEQAERASIRNAAATGGLGGGNIRRELQRQAIGFAQQDFNTRVGQLGQQAGRGQQAGGQLAQLDIQAANIEQQTGVNLGQIAQQTGLSVGDIVSTISRGQAGLRTQAGRDIANAISGTTAALSGLQQQQGAGISDIIGTQVSNIGNLLLNQGLSTAAGQEQQAVILANITTGQGSVAANVASNIGIIRGNSILARGSAISDGINGVADALGDDDFLAKLLGGK